MPVVGIHPGILHVDENLSIARRGFGYFLAFKNIGRTIP
jgi:hypothetical protein